MITRENYEEYIVDYWEDRLSESLRKELEYFLANHPDIRECVIEASRTKLIPSHSVFNKKTLLKRTEPDERTDYYAIAAAENVLTEKERTKEKSLKPLLQESVMFYSKLKLVPDPSVHYVRKRELYRRSGWAWIVRSGGVAALLCIVFGIVFRWVGEEKVMNESSFVDRKSERKAIMVKSETRPLLSVLEVNEKKGGKLKAESRIVVTEQKIVSEREESEKNRRLEPVIAQPLEGILAVNHEIVLGPGELHLPNKIVFQRKVLKRSELLTGFIPDMKISDNVISNLIRAAKNWKERSKNSEDDCVLR